MAIPQVGQQASWELGSQPGPAKPRPSLSTVPHLLPTACLAGMQDTGRGEEHSRYWQPAIPPSMTLISMHCQPRQIP